MTKSKLLVPVMLLPLLVGCGNSWNSVFSKDLFDANLIVQKDAGITNKTEVILPAEDSVIEVYDGVSMMRVLRANGNVEIISLIKGSVLLSFPSAQAVDYSITCESLGEDYALCIEQNSAGNFISFIAYDKFTNVIFETKDNVVYTKGFSIGFSSYNDGFSGTESIVEIYSYDVNTSNYVRSTKKYKSDYTLESFISHSERTSLKEMGQSEYSYEFLLNGDAYPVLVGYKNNEAIYSTTLNIELSDFSSSMVIPVGTTLLYQKTSVVTGEDDYDVYLSAQYLRVDTYAINALNGQQRKVEDFKFYLGGGQPLCNKNKVYDTALIYGYDYSNSKDLPVIVYGQINSKFEIVDSKGGALPYMNFKVGNNYYNAMTSTLYDSSLRPLGTFTTMIREIIAEKYFVAEGDFGYGLLDENGKWLVEPAYSNYSYAGNSGVIFESDMFNYFYDFNTKKIELTEKQEIAVGFLLDTTGVENVYQVLRDGNKLFEIGLTDSAVITCMSTADCLNLNSYFLSMTVTSLENVAKIYTYQVDNISIGISI